LGEHRAASQASERAPAAEHSRVENDARCRMKPGSIRNRAGLSGPALIPRPHDRVVCGCSDGCFRNGPRTERMGGFTIDAGRERRLRARGFDGRGFWGCSGVRGGALARLGLERWFSPPGRGLLGGRCWA
jgi:hypothetical protein